MGNIVPLPPVGYANDINESENVPLIGMQLLRGYDLRIQAIEGGSVTIEALPSIESVKAMPD
jgi:hypothetical protein